MSALVDIIMQDIGLYGITPGTFPELLTWLARSTLSIALLAGVFKTLFWIVALFDSGRKVRF